MSKKYEPLVPTFDNNEILINFKNESPIKIAYLILVHRLPKQFKRLFKAVYSIDNTYLIHIDNKTGHQLKDEVETFLLKYPNAHILESENVTWGGYSMVNVELNGIKKLIEIDAHWDYFINLSGQDYPLKSQDIIRDYLTKNKDNNFIKILDQQLIRPDTMNRIENFFEESNNGFIGIPFKRVFLKDTIPFIGGQWMILTRNCCEFICHSGESKKFEDFYLNTLIADEGFFQTLLMNSSFDGNIINDDKRAIIWVPDGDIKLRPKTFEASDLSFLTNGSNLFARKFDDHVDDEIIDQLLPTYHLTLDQEVSLIDEPIWQHFERSI